MKTYRYEMEGTAGKGLFKTSGTVSCEAYKVFEEAMTHSFALLTEGKAEFNHPGPCGGPYGLRRIVIELEDSEK